MPAGFIDAAVLRVLVDVNNSKANAELSRTQKTLKATQGVAVAALKAMAVAAPVAAGAMIKLASDAEEVESKFKIVFGREAPRAVKALDAFSRATGTSRYELRRQAADFQALIRPMGLSTGKAADMSVGLTKLATDLASFNNTSVEEAMMALRSGLVGESEPLRRFGVQLSATRVQAYAYANGIARSGKELTAAQKAQAAYALILEDTKLAQGDAVRTAGSFANQFKRLRANVTDLATSIGTALLPAATAIVSWLNSIPGRVQAVTKFLEKHETAIMAVGAALGTAGAAYLALQAKAIPGATKALLLNAKAWIAANAAMLANPAVRVAAMLATLAAALVVAYKESETFRKIVDRAFTIVKRVASAVLGWLVSAIRRDFERIRSIAQTVWTFFERHIVSTLRDVLSVARTVIGALVNMTVDRFRLLRTVAGEVWRQIEERIVTPIRDARETISRVWTQVRERALSAWRNIRGDVGDFASSVKDRVEGAFKGAANKVIGFVRKIIGVVNKIPGVDISMPAFLAAGGTLSRAGVQMLARGGWTNGPMAIVGEGRPQYPEVVIPTDPQYRNNSLKLMAQAAQKLGIGISQLPTYAKGGMVGGIASDMASLPAAALSGGAKWFLGQLPNPADMLPGWLKGFGKWAIGKVGSYIKDKVGDLFGGMLGGQLGAARGSLANIAREAAAFGLILTSGYRPGDPGWHGRNRARDFSNGSGPTPQMMAFARFLARTYGSRLLELIYTPLGFSIKNGQRVPPFAQADHYDHVHVAMARGGMLDRNKAVTGPFVGSFKNGGTVPQDGLAYVHRGERITPGGAGVIIQGDLIVEDRRDVDVLAARLAWLTDNG